MAVLGILWEKHYSNLFLVYQPCRFGGYYNIRLAQKGYRDFEWANLSIFHIYTEYHASTRERAVILY